MLPPRSAAAATAARHAGTLRLSEWRSRLRLRPRGASFILPDDDGIAFLKITRNDLRYAAVCKTGSNQAGFDGFVSR